MTCCMRCARRAVEKEPVGIEPQLTGFKIHRIKVRAGSLGKQKPGAPVFLWLDFSFGGQNDRLLARGLRTNKDKTKPFFGVGGHFPEKYNLSRTRFQETAGVKPLVFRALAELSAGLIKLLLGPGGDKKG